MNNECMKGICIIRWICVGKYYALSSPNCYLVIFEGLIKTTEISMFGLYSGNIFKMCLSQNNNILIILSIRWMIIEDINLYVWLLLYLSMSPKVTLK